jgi:uncharacterized membrane protein
MFYYLSVSNKDWSRVSTVSSLTTAFCDGMRILFQVWNNHKVCESWKALNTHNDNALCYSECREITNDTLKVWSYQTLPYPVVFTALPVLVFLAYASFFTPSIIQAAVVVANVFTAPDGKRCWWWLLAENLFLSTGSRPQHGPSILHSHKISHLSEVRVIKHKRKGLKIYLISLKPATFDTEVQCLITGSQISLIIKAFSWNHTQCGNPIGGQWFLRKTYLAVCKCGSLNHKIFLLYIKEIFEQNGVKLLNTSHSCASHKCSFVLRIFLINFFTFCLCYMKPVKHEPHVLNYLMLQDRLMCKLLCYNSFSKL